MPYKSKDMIQDEIWIIDDDRDDHELVLEIVKELNIPNKVLFFDGAKAFLKHLDEMPSAPFIILCDVNLPGSDGYQIREKLLEEANKKHHSVPFIFWSNTASEQQIDKAYKLRAHGFFVKEANYSEWKETFMGILNYWRKCKMPAKEDAPDVPLK